MRFRFAVGVRAVCWRLFDCRIRSFDRACRPRPLLSAGGRSPSTLFVTLFVTTRVLVFKSTAKDARRKMNRYWREIAGKNKYTK